MRIGELLVMNGLITDEQLEQGLEEQRAHPAKLGEILVGKQYINERQLVEALEFQLGIPVANLSEAAFDLAAVQLIPEYIARKYRVLPVGRDGSKLRVAMVDPLDPEAVKQIQMASGLHVLPMIAVRSEMEEAIVRYYGSDESAEELKRILQAGIDGKAEGVHLEAAEQGLNVRLRLGDTLQDHGKVAKSLQPSLIGRIKQMAGLTAESKGKPVPQTGRIQTDVDHKPVEIRVSTLPTLHGEDLYLLLTDPYSPLLKLSELDIGESHLQEIEKSLKQPGGLLIVSGPPSSGRTSTAYSLTEHVRTDDRKTVSLEDPIVRVMPGFTQVEVSEQTGLTMARALRAALRHKPDLVLVDGVSEQDTIETVLLASRHGLKIIGTMTARHSIDTLARLMSLERDSELLASSLACIVTQRLARRVCRQCVQSAPATDEEIRRFQEAGLLSPEDLKNAAKGTIGNFRSFVYTHMSGKPAVARGSGCRACGNTGYKGRIALQEVLTIDDSLRRLIAERRPIAEIEKHVLTRGHKSLLHDGLAKAREGLTTVEEVLQATK